MNKSQNPDRSRIPSPTISAPALNAANGNRRPNPEKHAIPAYLEDQPQEAEWYKDAIIYELHVKSFHDSNADGVGDFPGLIQKLDYLQDLGVNCLWLLPFFPSPLKDDGYDIADYCNVAPMYGTMEDFQLFVHESHQRGMRVIIELVINHTSDQHPWFQAARRAPLGSPERDMYVWSDTDQKYRDVRIIFTDTEKSNWAWDDVANAYYWHRFFSHQPDLNYDSPLVLEKVGQAMDFWLDKGVDGLRLDAVPYLCVREGTNCENLPETHSVIKKLRKRMDSSYKNRMFLAEANQWPDDVRPYFGDGAGDECHMAFHFPVMPRIFMALRQEDRHPIADILERTPEIPQSSQWALFLRNHDELTLEMVTNEERDFMYREYAADPQARLNLGIRRRLGPLLHHSRRRMELLNSLLLSMPGTPVIYYGDEIGMGDNIYLGDRNGVRTPMQWSIDRNAGFSKADFARLFSPPVMDPIYGFQAVNVEAQQRDPSSLLNWMKRIIALRKKHPIFGRGAMSFLKPANRKVLAYIRRHEDHIVLVAANLSRFVQPVELDLSDFEGYSPVEMFGGAVFPVIGDAPYFLSLGPHTFYWFTLKPPTEAFTQAELSAKRDTWPTITVSDGWNALLKGKAKSQLERDALPKYLVNQRWYAGKGRTLKKTRILDDMPGLPALGNALILIIEVTYTEDSRELYLLPLSIAQDAEAASLQTSAPRQILAKVIGPAGEGILHDALLSDAFCLALLAAIAGRREMGTRLGLITSKPTQDLDILAALHENPKPSLRRNIGEQSNSSIVYGDAFYLKLFRRLDLGPNLDAELSLFLSQRAQFSRIPKTLGLLDYQLGQNESTTLAMLQELVANQGSAWDLALHQLRRYYEEYVHQPKDPQAPDQSPAPAELSIYDLMDLQPDDAVQEALGSVLSAAEILGQRTAEMHQALAHDNADPNFTPLPFTSADRVQLLDRIRAQMNLTLKTLKANRNNLPESIRNDAQQLIDQAPQLEKSLENALQNHIVCRKIRCHGDYHLGQVLYVNNDFFILDFEGEPSLPLAQRRAKFLALKDVAGMLRSLDYAAVASMFEFAQLQLEDGRLLEHRARLWRQWCSAKFLKGYLAIAQTDETGFLPNDWETTKTLLEIHVLEKAFYELHYELNHRPDWVRIPLRGLMELLPQGDPKTVSDNTAPSGEDKAS